MHSLVYGKHDSCTGTLSHACTQAWHSESLASRTGSLFPHWRGAWEAWFPYGNSAPRTGMSGRLASHAGNLFLHWRGVREAYPVWGFKFLKQKGEGWGRGGDLLGDQSIVCWAIFQICKAEGGGVGRGGLLGDQSIVCRAIFQTVRVSHGVLSVKHLRPHPQPRRSWPRLPPWRPILFQFQRNLRQN